ncbi:MAG: hypothetical protein V3S26_04905 [Acidimicrobiia bacterium]
MFSHAWRLRWSGEIHEYDIRIEGIADPAIDVGVPGGMALVGLVDDMVKGDITARQQARDAILNELGPESLVDAAAVFGNFEMMNRVAEGTGITVAPQVLEREAEMMKTLGLRDTMKSQHS